MTSRYKSRPIDWTRRNSVPAILLLIITSAVIGYSLWQGSYTFDPHNWGLMLSNAIDLSNGMRPYDDILIQYGIMSTVFHSLAYIYLGENLLALIGITSLFYAVGLVGIYFLSLRLTNDKKLAIFSLITAYLIHPVATLPWSNYMAFPFLVFGIFLLCDIRQRNLSFFLSGLTLSLGILCRENFFAPILLLAIIFSIFKFFSIRDDGIPLKVQMRNVASFWIGLLIPITLFFVYLQKNSLLDDWHTIAVILPGWYMEWRLPDGLVGIGLDFLAWLTSEIASGTVRITIFALIIFSASYFSLLFLVSRVTKFKLTKNINQSNFLVAIFGLGLISSALHISEVMRLSTGLILAIPLVYILAQQFKLDVYVFLIAVIALIGSYVLDGSFRDGFILEEPISYEKAKSVGNYAHPSAESRALARLVSSPQLFSGQKWPPEVRDLYLSLQEDIELLSHKNCGVGGFWNTTSDAFITSMMPLKRLSVAPWQADFNARLLPSLGSEPDLSKQKNLVMVMVADRRNLSHFVRFLPTDYKIGRYYDSSSRSEESNKFVIIAPRRCAQFFDSAKSVQVDEMISNLFADVNFESEETVFVDDSINLTQIRHENLNDKIKRKAFGFLDEPAPDYSDIEFERYVDKYPDLRAAFNSGSRTASKAEWGREHFAYFGSKEGRNVLPSLLVKNSAGELIFKRNSHKDYLQTPFFPLISKPNGGSRWLSVERSSPSDFSKLHCRIYVHNKDWSYVDELQCADAFTGRAIFHLPKVIPGKVALVIDLQQKSYSAIPHTLRVSQFHIKESSSQ
jgi:hypothetical protein